MTVFTISQLALHNGQDKETSYIAYKGLIYDVTNSRLWDEGKHYQHWAGQDLTSELAEAPHSDIVFKKFKVVGKLLIE